MVSGCYFGTFVVLGVFFAWVFSSDLGVCFIVLPSVVSSVCCFDVPSRLLQFWVLVLLFWLDFVWLVFAGLQFRCFVVCALGLPGFGCVVFCGFGAIPKMVFLCFYFEASVCLWWF